jgi:hypothetical protein
MNRDLIDAFPPKVLYNVAPTNRTTSWLNGVTIEAIHNI